MRTASFFQTAKPVRHILTAWCIALAAALALIESGIGSDVERIFGNLRAGILDKSASEEVVIVEIDARSLQATDSWPWPRTYYARAIDRLNQAGVSRIGIKVDFSSPSTEQQDRALAWAIANSRATVVLPTIRQRASMNADEFVESLPIPMLREHAMLGSVSVDLNGHRQLNEYSYGTTTNGIARPSFATVVAEQPGDINTSFTIDQTINPTSIPRLSFIDLLNGEALPNTLRGKKVMIGSTAIQHGDRYPLSLYGVVPGVVIQAMAAETLIERTNFVNLGKFPALFLTALILLCGIRSRSVPLAAMNWLAVATGFGIFGLLLLAEYLNLFTFSNVPALFFLGIYLLAQKFLNMGNELTQTQHINLFSGLPNELAMLKTTASQEFQYIATARLSDFRELLVVTSTDARQELYHNLAERLKYLAKDEEVYHLDTDMFGWIVKRDYIDDLQGYFDTANALLQAPVSAGETRIKLSASFGVSGESVNKSKIASEQAFAAGKKWSRHDKESDQAIGQKHNLLVELDHAIEKGELTVVYQPKWRLKENDLDGAEVLVRWAHPEQGMISPDVFIPLLERAGRIDELSFFVLQQALDDLAQWDKLRPNLTCSVNISAKLLGDARFVERAIALVDRSPVDNRQIVFEVTETAALADPELSVFALNRIRDSGIRTSIDDYGTGQSTMSYLQRLPVSEIKLDQSFVKTMNSDNTNRVMVRSTIKMAHALGFKIVAEGIEDQQCLELLTEYGCDIGQGWHIAKPVETAEFESVWLRSDAGQARLSA